MYSTPLKSLIDKNRASFLLSLILKPEQKIKFALCSDLIIENSLFNEANEHYYYDPVIPEFWQNYNTSRMYLYTTVLQHLKLAKDTLQSTSMNMSELKSINRSSIVFISNNLTANHAHGTEIINEPPSQEEVRKLFTKKNKVTKFKPTTDFRPSDDCTVLECVKYKAQLREFYQYFNNIIDKVENLYIITDHSEFKKRFRRHIHINDDYYLCYEKEK